jgi:type II restriction/modification system DNA methylase subunit YeeA
VSEKVVRLKEFVEYTKLLDGDEKGEAQVFCDRLFKAFGHGGYKEAGAILEYRVKKKGTKAGTSFADLVWKGRLLLEMKKRGEKLHLYYQQAFDYWVRAVPRRPRFVMLCNFDEFWIYDFDRQIDTPLDVVRVADLPKRYPALNFLFPDDPPPLFGNDREGVTREAADEVAQVFNSLVQRGEDRDAAQRFILQTVVAMFAEDMDFLPRGLIAQLIQECKAGASSYDLFGALFRQMDSEAPAKAGRFREVPYFNGGLFETQAPIDLTAEELERISDAAAKDWSKVNPAIFGALFQGCMNAEARHAFGAHYTHEADILRVVQPTIVRPWQARIAAATTMKELLGVRKEMLAYRVLDPACGSGNFLYVAYRELVRLEIGLLAKLRATVSAKEFDRSVKTLSLISPRQFFGIDQDSFGIELAKVTLMLAKKLALDEAVELLDRRQIDLDLHEDHALPLDNLDANFTCGDALFVEWPQVDAIIGNPPFQSKNKMQEEYGRAYVNAVRKRYPEVPGRADYCVYWFRRAHDQLALGNRAGLVGTNTIRQNYSREGGLDYIAQHGGAITEAVSSQVWSGEAAVHVSIVNWVKGTAGGRSGCSANWATSATRPGR